MTGKAARNHSAQHRPYRVSPFVRTLFMRGRSRIYWQRMQQPGIAPQRYWVRSQRAYVHNLIRGELVTHRRMFGVSHKHVQHGQTPATPAGQE